ncbi:MAG: RagB/SusD family nutrient uptake outer membrane protein [Bacteroidales bacterium]
MKTINISYIKLVIIASAALILTSCNDYLDEIPSKSSGVPITKIDQLNGLLSNVYYLETERNDLITYGSDSYEVTPELYNAAPYLFSSVSMCYNLWEVQEVETDPDNLSFWAGEYKKIFTANIILLTVGDVDGTEEEKNQIRAEAHLLRAYSYLTLVNTYCLPYCEKNKSEMGLPIKRSTSYEEDVARASLETTYNFIEEDINEALKVTTSAKSKRNWRGNIAAANGLAARFYLIKGDYSQALQYANAALDDYDELVNYNSDMSTVTNEITINGSSESEVVTLTFPYTFEFNIYSGWNLLANYKGSYYYRRLFNYYQWFVPSAKLLSLYDKTYDLRYQYNIVQNYSYYKGMTDPAYSYPGYCDFDYCSLSGPSSAEMLLIKAECIARDPSLGSVADAMSAVNILRAMRFSSSAPAEVVNLSAATNEEAVLLILEERQREMPFTQRWFDIRRCNSNSDSFDDVTLTKSFYPVQQTAVLDGDPVKEFSIDPNSRKYAAPIPSDELVASKGVIKQNTY